MCGGIFKLAADEGLRYSELAIAINKKFLALSVGLVYLLVEGL